MDQSESSAISSLRNIIGNMSSPRFSPMAIPSSSRSRKRKALQNIAIEILAYHFPGDTPLKKLYEMKTLKEAHNFSLTLTEESTEIFVSQEILEIMSAEYNVPRDFFKGNYTFYCKQTRKNELKMFVYSSLHRFDYAGLKAMTTKDKRKLFIIINRPLPGINAPTFPISNHDVPHITVKDGIHQLELRFKVYIFPCAYKNYF